MKHEGLFSHIAVKVSRPETPYQGGPMAGPSATKANGANERSGTAME